MEFGKDSGGKKGGNINLMTVTEMITVVVLNNTI